MKTVGSDEFQQSIKQLLPALIAAGAFSGAVNLLYLSSPLYLMQIYNRVLTSGSVATLVMLTIALIVALLTMAALDTIRARILIRSAMRLDRLLAPRIVDAMIERGARASEEKGAQALRDFDQFRTVIAGPSLHFLFDAPWAPLYLLVLFLIDPLLGVVATVGALLLLGLAVINEFATRTQLFEANATAARNYGFTASMVENSDIVRVMGLKQGLARHWQADRDRMLAYQASASDRTADFAATIRFFRLLLQALMLAVGAWLVIDHAILPATIFAASVVMGRSLVPVEQAVSSWRQFGTAGEAALRIRKLLREQPAPRTRTRLQQPDGAIAFDRVVYVAPGGSKPILKGVSFTLAAGESLAIIGASGAGKSTLARLMVGATAPSTGHVRLSGADLSLWPREELGRHIGYLPEAVGLFNGTVRDNIARFTDASDEEVVAAAARAGVHDLILELPAGYDTVLNDGRELSAGQRQRIGLARALLGVPRLVVLDEPNAHLDGAGERALENALRELCAKKTTVVIIAHRPVALSFINKLMVVRNGLIEMIGPRAEIVENLRKQVVRPVAAEAKA